MLRLIDSVLPHPSSSLGCVGNGGERVRPSEVLQTLRFYFRLTRGEGEGQCGEGEEKRRWRKKINEGRRGRRKSLLFPASKKEREMSGVALTTSSNFCNTLIFARPHFLFANFCYFGYIFPPDFPTKVKNYRLYLLLYSTARTWEGKKQKKLFWLAVFPLLPSVPEGPKQKKAISTFCCGN